MNADKTDTGEILPAIGGPWRLGAVRVVGRDSADFINRLLTCAVKSLAPIQGSVELPWIPGCLLSGDGRIRHEVVVVRLGELDFGVIPVGLGRAREQGGHESLRDALDAYHFTETLELQEWPVWVGYGTNLAGECAGRASGQWGAAGLSLRADFLVSGDGILLRDAEKSQTEQDDPNPGVFPAGVPTLGRDYLHTHLPLEAGLKDCISFTKGCFPGQEIMARIENLGHPAKVLVVLDPGVSGVQAGDILISTRSDGTELEVGVVSSVPGPIMLAMVKWGWHETGTALRAGHGQVIVLSWAAKYHLVMLGKT